MSTALARAHELLERALAELELAKPGLPSYAVAPATLLRADVRAAARQLSNMLKCVGAGNKPPS